MIPPRASFLLAAGLIVAILLSGCDEPPYVDTDDPPARSGLSVYTDHGTGCQYLERHIYGGITPRLGSDGKPMCGEPRP